MTTVVTIGAIRSIFTGEDLHENPIVEVVAKSLDAIDTDLWKR